MWYLQKADKVWFQKIYGLFGLGYYCTRDWHFMLGRITGVPPGAQDAANYRSIDPDRVWSRRSKSFRSSSRSFSDAGSGSVVDASPDRFDDDQQKLIIRDDVRVYSVGWNRIKLLCLWFRLSTSPSAVSCRLRRYPSVNGLFKPKDFSNCNHRRRNITTQLPQTTGELGRHLTQCGLRQGVPPYQVAS